MRLSESDEYDQGPHWTGSMISSLKVWPGPLIVVCFAYFGAVAIWNSPGMTRDVTILSLLEANRYGT